MFCEMETKTGIEVVSLLLLVVAIIIRTSSAATARSSFEYNVAADYHGTVRQLLWFSRAGRCG
jgi:hypothetical protein